MADTVLCRNHSHHLIETAILFMIGMNIVGALYSLCLLHSEACWLDGLTVSGHTLAAEIQAIPQEALLDALHPGARGLPHGHLRHAPVVLPGVEAQGLHPALPREVPLHVHVDQVPAELRFVQQVEDASYAKKDGNIGGINTTRNNPDVKKQLGAVPQTTGDQRS